MGNLLYYPMLILFTLNNNNNLKTLASIQYCRNISDKIQEIFNDHNINIGYKTTNYVQKKTKKS